MRKRLFEIIEVAEENDRLSLAYDLIMMSAIAVSIVPLAFKTPLPCFHSVDITVTILFILDYLFRWITADYKFKEQSAWSFGKYPFTPWAIIDLLSILPGLTLLNSSFKLLRCLRMFQTLRILRVFKALRYSKSFSIVLKVIRNSLEPLQAVCTLAVAYIVITALIIFNVEGDSFNTFFDAIYWATVSLTTVGYGDIYPVTVSGRIIAMLSSFFGIAVVALPAGIITAGYMDALRETKDTNEAQQ